MEQIHEHLYGNSTIVLHCKQEQQLDWQQLMAIFHNQNRT